MTRAYVGLGANLGPREQTLRTAVQRLSGEDGVDVLAVSELRETDPVGVEEQPRFLNGAVALETTLSARELRGRRGRWQGRLRSTASSTGERCRTHHCPSPSARARAESCTASTGGWSSAPVT